MIPRLNASSLSFRANDVTSARDAYSAQIDKNLQTAQKQNGIVTSLMSQLNVQIPMHGQGQKLDVIA